MFNEEGANSHSIDDVGSQKCQPKHQHKRLCRPICEKASLEEPPSLAGGRRLTTFVRAPRVDALAAYIILSPDCDGGRAGDLDLLPGSLGTKPLLGPSPPQSLAETMHTASVMCRNGDCYWPKYDGTQRSTMHFDGVSKLVLDPLWVNAYALERPSLTCIWVIPVQFAAVARGM